MATNILALKKEAVKLGMDKNEAKKANRSVLEDFIKSAGTPKSKKKSLKKSSAAKPKHKTATAKKTATKKATTKKSAAPKAAAKKAPAAKSAKAGKAKRPSPKAENTGVGRLSLDGKIDWAAESEEWNPRAGGPVERLFKALKKARGDVDKAADALASDVWDFVGKIKRNGEKRTKAEANAMLRYRLNRTKWEFATRTGQHNPATDRVEYGTGDYASTRRKGAAKKSNKTAAKKPERKPAAAKKRGRPVGSKSKPKASTKKRAAKK